jgi:hypothetical protein
LVVLVVVLIMMPADLQDYAIDTLLPMVWGAWVLGMDWLWQQDVSAAVVPSVFLFLCYVEWRLMDSRKRRLSKMATKAPAGPIEALLGKILRAKQRDFTAETSGVALAGAGVESSAEFAAVDDYGAGGAPSTNPLMAAGAGVGVEGAGGGRRAASSRSK